jgi:protein-tyrosine phosphatase
VSSSALSGALQQDHTAVLLLDCRSFMDFNSCHIISAHNVHCPPIVKRRSGGVLSLENIIRCGQTRAKLLAGNFNMVVAYDEGKASASQLAAETDTNMSLVLRSLTEAEGLTNVYFLEDGFSTFHRQMSHLCSDATVLPSALSPTCNSPYQPSPILKIGVSPHYIVHPSSPLPSTSSPFASSSAGLHSPLLISPLGVSSPLMRSMTNTPSPLVLSSLSTSARTTPRYSTPPGLVIDHHLLQPPSNQSFQNSYNSPLRDQQCHLRIILDQGDPVQILPWLYLGSVAHASQRSRLKALGITALLNVSPQQPNHISEDFLYKTIPVVDNQTSEISEWFPEAIEFIESIRNGDGKVLVHCQAGVSRSATICIAYLMNHLRISMEQAFDYLKSRRSVISPNINFMCQLLDYEAQLNISTERELAQNIKPTLRLTLTPLTPVGCNQEAGVFVFDSPLTPLAPSPVQQSPLVSPS